MMIFRQLFDPGSSTYTYLLADESTREAVLIDPVFEQVLRDSALISELGLKLLWALDTHCHADHVTGAWLLKSRLGSRIGISRASGAEGADRLLVSGDTVSFGAHHLMVRSTPGHTKGCLSFVLDDRSRAFTGDCLLIRGTGRTDFQQGDAGMMYRSVHEEIFSLPDQCLLYPGHDYRGLTVTSVAEEKAFNPRLGGSVSKEDFLGHMANLKLAHPKQLDIAVPANLRCGETENAHLATASPRWAPVTFTFAGNWEIQPHALYECHTPLQLLDVREPDEFTGPLGHIRGAILIPLGELSARVGELKGDCPIVAVCHAGSRSAQALNILRQAGFTDLANVAGGMVRWRAEAHPVEAASH